MNSGIEEGRKWRMWWVVGDCAEVVHAKGYECPNAQMWWVPSIGYSMTEDYLFTTEEQATAKAKEECRKQIAFWQDRLSKL